VKPRVRANGLEQEQRIALKFFMKENMMYRKIKFLTFLIAAASILLNCGGSDDPKPSRGTLVGTVTDFETGLALEGVHVLVFNADNNAPSGTTLLSDAEGKFQTKLAPGPEVVSTKLSCAASARNGSCTFYDCKGRRKTSSV
jgi:hypothetical protein